MPEGREEIVALLALERVEGIGHERLRRLLAHFGSARAALEAADWAVAVGRGGPWRRPGQAEFAWAEAQWERCDAEGGRCLAPVDADYPELLRHIPAPPPLLFALGPDDLAGPTVAIVGPRKASEYGLQVAGELAHGLALRGICIVSGPWPMELTAQPTRRRSKLADGPLQYWAAAPTCPIPAPIPGFTARFASGGRSSPSLPGVPSPTGAPSRGATGLSAG